MKYLIKYSFDEKYIFYYALGVGEDNVTEEMSKAKKFESKQEAEDLIKKLKNRHLNIKISLIEVLDLSNMI